MENSPENISVIQTFLHAGKAQVIVDWFADGDVDRLLDVQLPDLIILDHAPVVFTD